MKQKINLRQFNINRKTCRDYVSGFSDNKEVFIAQFRIDFDSVLVYHASNLNQQEQNEIRKNGFVLSTDDFMKTKACEKFVRDSDSVDVQQKIRQAIDENFESRVGVENSIYFSHLQDELLTDSTQYLLYGPETLLPLADELRNRLYINFRQRMIEHGDHCMVIADIPVSFMRDYDIGAIYEYVVNDWPECCLKCYENVPAVCVIKIDKYPRPVNIYE